MSRSAKIFSTLKVTVLVTVLAGMAGCATTSDERDPRDPWEGFNRGAFEFNRGLDKAIVRPIAKLYHYVTPNFLEQGIENFVTNLSYPVTIVNLLLQGKFEDFGVSLGRFALNSTFGLAGLVDVASEQGIPRHNEDFGQTFAVWGWENSPFLMLPVLGPSTLRDGVGRIPEFYTDGVSIASNEFDRFEPLVANILTLRVNLFDLDDDLNEAADPYLLVRDAYLQSREFQITDGETELPDYDEFLDEQEDFEQAE